MDEEEVCMMTPFFPIVAGRLEFRLRNAATGKAPPRRNIKSTRMCDILWKEGKLLLLQEDLLEELQSRNPRRSRGEVCQETFFSPRFPSF